MYKTIKNDKTGIIHAVNNDYPERPVPYSLCNLIGPYLGHWSVGRYEHKSMRNSMVTCKHCRTILGLLDGRKPDKPWEAKSIFDTIATNKSSGVAHAVWNGQFTKCGLIEKPFRNHILSGHNNRIYFERSITCKTCRKSMGIGPLTPKKAKWIALHLGDTDTSDVGWSDQWEELEFEISICRSDHKFGLRSAGWADLNKKIILFDNEDYLISEKEDIEWMKKVSEALAFGMNEKGL